MEIVRIADTWAHSPSLSRDLRNQVEIAKGTTSDKFNEEYMQVHDTLRLVGQPLYVYCRDNVYSCVMFDKQQ